VRVDVTKEPKLSKIEELFILLTENDSAPSGLPKELGAEVAAAISEAAFKGRSDEGITILRPGSPSRITLIGLGKAERISARLLKAALYGVAKIARRNRAEHIAVAFPYTLPGHDLQSTTRLAVDLLSNADYKYDKYKSRDESEPSIKIRSTWLASTELTPKDIRILAEEGEILASAVQLVRDLGNTPPNELTPTRLAQRAKETLEPFSVKCTVFDKKAIEKLSMGGLLAVARGSQEEPRFVVMEYTPKRARKTVCLVGKGITFDSGGISIKPADRMEEMKFDMAGAAAVIGIMQAAARLELPVRLIGLVATTENLPSGSAYKPGDIIRMMSGKSVEIVNTDAEGRMILGDALHYAARFEPDHLIDFATLTGACVVALGAEATGIFSSDDVLAQKLIDAGEHVGERLWRLPEWDEYKEQIRSEWADMKNSGGRWGGAITAAVFLKEFVKCPSWAHLDIAGTAWAEGETAREPKGATGVGVRATIEFLQRLSRS